MAEDDNAVDGSSLCMQCGLCCQGVLHEWGGLTEAEYEPLAALGMIVERRPDYLSFHLPCSKVDGTICTIYEHRPETCAGYRCALLKRYQEGEIAMEDAVPRVHEARQLLARVEGLIPAGHSLRDVRLEWRARMRGETTGKYSADQQEQLSGAYFQLAVLHFYIDRHFRLDREKTFMRAEDHAAASVEKSAG